jgi:crotonobetainyl-CoA:carnitine CoA-transferase CaiB-like acyl-CoA transferase
VVREPSGTTITGIVPTNTYRCADQKFVIIGGNGDSIYRRLMVAAGREDLAFDARLQDNAGRVQHQEEIDQALVQWTKTLTAPEVLHRLEEAEVPAGPIYNVVDMLQDPHYQARGLFEEVTVGERPLKVPAIVPKLSSTPGRTDWPGEQLGAHTAEVLHALLGLSPAEVEELAASGVL